MKPGNKKIPLFIFFFSLFSFISQAEDKIVSTPLLNLDNIKPSFEIIDEKNPNLGEKKDFKNKTERQKNTNTPSAISERAPMKQLSSIITGPACSGSSTPPMPAPPET